MSEEHCTKHNKPLDCVRCEFRESLTSNLNSTKIECKYGKFEFNIGANSISSLVLYNGGNLKCLL